MTVFELADAIAEELNETAFAGFEFVAEQRLAPVSDVKEIANLTVDVVPGTWKPEWIARGLRRKNYLVSVVVRKKAANDQEVKDLSGFLEAVESHMLKRNLTGTGWEAVWIESEIEPLFDFESWRTLRIYMGIVTFQYAIVAREDT